MSITGWEHRGKLLFGTWALEQGLLVQIRVLGEVARLLCVSRFPREKNAVPGTQQALSDASSGNVVLADK